MFLDAMFPVVGDILGSKLKQGFKDGRYTIQWKKTGDVLVRLNGKFSKLLGTEDFKKLQDIGADFVYDSKGTLKEIKFNKDLFNQKGAVNFGEIVDAVKGKKYKTTVNINDKNDLAYLSRILKPDQIADIKAGKMTNRRGINYEDLAKVNIVSETPKTVEQQRIS